MQAVSEFFKLYWPWIVGSLLPSIVVALTTMPNERANKVGDVIKRVLDFLSVLTHKDAPGTLQLPFKLGKLADNKTPPAAPPAAPAALLLILTLSVSSGCAWWSEVWADKGPEVTADLIDCSKETVLANAPQLLPAIKAIIHGDSATWKKQLAAFIKEFGKDIVACAVRQVSEDLFMSLPPQGTEPTPEQRMTLDDLNRVREFTAEQGWKFAPQEK